MILLTGGTGFVGRHILPRLLGEGHQVRVLSRSPPSGVSGPRVEWCRGSLTEDDPVRDAVRGVRQVIHAAGVLPAPDVDSLRLDDVNAKGTARLARFARTASVERFILVSSAGVYGDGDRPEPHREDGILNPGNAYERSKLAAERSVALEFAGSRVAWSVLRPQGLYGPDRPATSAFFAQVARRRLWIHSPTRVIVHPTHVDDLVAAVVLALQRDDITGEVLNIGGERALDFKELIGLVGQSMGRAPRQITLPASLAVGVRIIIRALPGGRRLPPSLVRLGRSVVNRAVDIDKARKRLGYSPVPLDWGIRATADALKAAVAS